MKRFKSILLVASAVLLVASGMQAPSASAQSSSLSTTPRKDYVIEPGKAVDDKFSVRNIDTVNDLTLYLQVVDFTYSDDTGSAKFLLDQDVDPTPWSLKNYLTVPTTVTIPKGESRSIDLNVKMPSNIGGGGYYSAILYSTSAPSGGNLGLAASVATLVFVSVPGDVNEDLKIEKFGAYNATKKTYNYISIDEPSILAYTLKNNGNVFEAPVGTITLKSMFGQEYKIDNINPNKNLALIGQSRTFQACVKVAAEKVNFQGSTTEASTCVSPGLWPGLYTASIDVFYGQNGNITKEANKVVHFWYLPLWFIIASLVVLLTLAFYIWRTIVWMKGGSFKLGGRPHTRKTSRRR